MNNRGWPSLVVGGMLILLVAGQKLPDPVATPSQTAAKKFTPAPTLTAQPTATNTPNPTPTQMPWPTDTPEPASLIPLPEPTHNIYSHLKSGDLANGILEQDQADLWTFNGRRGYYATIKLTPEESTAWVLC